MWRHFVARLCILVILALYAVCSSLNMLKRVQNSHFMGHPLDICGEDWDAGLRQIFVVNVNVLHNIF